jgi:NADPH:quinone reductase-like Zn-dependent oxidoreductase/acyl carrier protein
LGERQGTLRYVATDSDANAVNRLSSWLEGIRGTSAMVLDLTQSLAPTETQRFDVILSAFAFTRRRWGPDEIAMLRQHLAPNGLIVAAEPQPNALWNWIFGQDPAWWSGPEVGDVQGSPLRPIAIWRDMLTRGGFRDLATADFAADPWPAGVAVGRLGSDRAALHTRAPHAGMAIIVAEHDDPVAGHLRHLLADAGGTAEVIVPPEIGDGNLFCSLLSRLETELPDVVILPPREAATTDIVAATNSNLLRAITIAQLLAATRDRARLWIVTEDAQQTSGAAISREDAALWGLGRTLANEMPQLNCGLIDLPAGLDAAEAAAHLSAELLFPDGEREIVITGTTRRALRLSRGNPVAAAAASGPVCLAIGTPGRLDSLHWEPLPPRAPGAGEVAIAVHVADLNFRDVMWALDLLPEEALRDGHAGPTFGLACGGTITAVGSGVADLKPGDRVLAISPATLASETITTAHTVMRLPEGLDFAAAATLPVAFITAIYSLGHLGRLQAGERVLIHGGAGGVGIAAIQYALHCGAEVIATSGSPTKRAFLRELGAHHVLDSRDLAFVDAVRRLTGGAGVDIVLNSLSGDAMEQSMALLRPFGRFLELGKRDFFLGTRIGLRPLRKNISYFAIDIDTLAVERPSLAAAMMRQTIELIQTGALQTLPYRCFRRSEVVDAFRLMQASGHIGKILLNMLEPEKPSMSDRALLGGFTVHGSGTYLITGGLSGFGLATAEWLTRRGARSLALLGRRGATTPGAAEALVRLAALGVDARAFACDVTDREALARTLREIRREMAPLIGVFHAAMQIEDGLLGTLDGARLARVLAPKLGGARNLDALTRSDPIELFILYSSATTILGAPGQGSYVAANAALEGVVRRRRFEGLPGLVVGWGPIEDVGYLARNGENRDALSRRLAANSLAAKESLDALPNLWNSGEIAVAFASVRWDAARRMLPTLTSPTFRDLIGTGIGNSTGDLHDKLKAASVEERKDIILAILVEEMARILAAARTNVDPHRSVAELGMDSLMAVELRLALERRLGVNLPTLALSQQTSLAMIAADLARRPSAESDASPDIAAAVLHYETADPSAIGRPAAPADASAGVP